MPPALASWCSSPSFFAYPNAATDYSVDPDLAKVLYLLATLPAEQRFMELLRVGTKHGLDAAVRMIVEFIRLANSVAENARENAENLLVEFGEHPHTAEKINMPSIMGALNGLKLVDGIDTAALCHGCVFRQGSIANQSLPTTMDAEWCSSPGENPFMCHENMDAKGNPTAGCRGFAQRRAANNAAQRAELGGEAV